VQSRQNNETALSINDYDAYDSLDNPDEAGNRMDFSYVSAKACWFNKTGLSWVKRAGELSNNGTAEGWTLLMLRTQLDVDNIAPHATTRNVGGTIKTSESATVGLRPTLTIVWDARASSSTVEQGTVEQGNIA